MARFTFAKGRKKAPPQLILAEPMSKAHKILGSTPINIDSPKPWDDASSGFSGGTGDSTLPSYTSTDDGISDHQVAIAHSEDEWTNGSDILPAILEASGLDSDTDQGISEMSHSVRKTQSSSTIRSWYDKSKQPLSVTQQTSASSMAKGVPSKIHKMLDLETKPPTKTKKKPPMLDFSNLRSASRLSRKESNPQLRTDGTMIHDPEGAIQSPSVMSMMTPTGKSRKIQKRNTKDSMLSPTMEEERPHTTGGRRRGSSMKEVPSLYDHYEQMTLRHMMQEEAREEEEGPMENTDSKLNEPVEEETHQATGGSKDPHWLHDVRPKTPQTAFMTGLTPARFRDRSNSNTSKMTTSTRCSKSLDRADLQETSMLMLSSDSEEDEEPAPLPRSLPSSPNRRPSTASVSPRTVSRAPSSRAPSQASDYRPMRGLKRASFAPSNTYITIPNSSRLSSETAIPIAMDSRSSTPYTEAASCRTSLMSNASAFQGNNSNYIQEARAVTMVAGRRPSRVEYGEENSPDTASSSTGIPPPLARRPLNLAQTPPEQLTPPLSPTSVDFYIRSARSSIDGPGSQNRYMAVTRQEEMLLSALRHKSQHKEQQLPEQPEERLGEHNVPVGHDDESGDIRETEVVAAEAMFDFGFPAPPTAKRQTFFGTSIPASASISSRASTATTDKVSQDSIDEDLESLTDARQSQLSPPPAGPAPLRSILKKTSLQYDEPEQQDVILYLDDAGSEPSPDMTDFSEFGYLAMPSLQSEPPELPSSSTSPVSNALMLQIPPTPKSISEGKRVDRGYRSPSAMAPVPEDSELEYEEEDVPRPDSPISPDAFPAVPQIRTTLSTMARLSAVGSAPMSSEPGWWGDDD